MQMRVYHREMTHRGQRFVPLGWLCGQCGVLDYDDDIDEKYLPIPERKKRRLK